MIGSGFSFLVVFCVYGCVCVCGSKGKENFPVSGGGRPFLSFPPFSPLFPLLSSSSRIFPPFRFDNRRISFMSVLLQIEIKGGQECFVSSGKKVCGEWYFALLKLAPSRRPENCC